MKGLKKVVSLALAICMVFGVSACGNKKKSEDKDYINYVLHLMLYNNYLFYQQLF